MARPTEYPDFATDPNYTNGPDAGSITKIKPTIAELAEGFKNGKSYSPTAQAFNWWRNTVGLWTRHFDIRTQIQRSVYDAVGANTILKPSWVEDDTPVTLQLISSGGAGAGASASGAAAVSGGGGGSGTPVVLRLSGLDFSASTSATIGAPGSGGTGNASSPTDGGDGLATVVNLATGTVLSRGGIGGKSNSDGVAAGYGGYGGAGYHGGGGGGSSATVSGYNGGDYRALNGGIPCGGFPGERGRTASELLLADLRRGGDGGTASPGNLTTRLNQSSVFSSSGSGGAADANCSGGGGGAPGIIPIIPAPAGVILVPSVEAASGAFTFDAGDYGYGGGAGVGFGAGGGGGGANRSASGAYGGGGGGSSGGIFVIWGV